MPRKSKHISDVASFARTHTDQAIKCLVGIMNSPLANDSARVSSAIAVLDRGWGKSSQIVSLTAKTEREEIKVQLIELFGQIESTAIDITPTNESSDVLQ